MTNMRSTSLFIVGDSVCFLLYAEHYMNANCCLDSKKSVEVSFVDVKSVKFRDILRKFLKEYYALKSEILEALLEYREITFELLSVFFRLKSLIFMIPDSSEQPIYFIFKSGEMNKSNG